LKLIGTRPERKVVNRRMGDPVAVIYPGLASERRSALLALMEIRALSPHHSTGLKGAELQRRFGKRRSDRFAVNVKNNLRNLRQVFYSRCVYAAASVR
jgi:hypothetical protein